MKTYLLVSSTFKYVQEVACGFLPSLTGENVDPIFVQLPRAASGNVFLQEFRRVVGLIEKHHDSSRAPIAIWLPMPRSRLVSPTDGGNSFEALCAMLILAFPEVLWMPIFGDNGASPEGKQEDRHHCDFFCLARNMALMKKGYSPLFDGEGIRNHIRAQICDATISTRSKIATAIDEETDCALTHAYVAYRFGFRAYAATTYGLTEFLLGGEAFVNNELLFEDICLSFPDERTEGFSLLKNRDERLPGLRSPKYRVFVSSGLADAETASKNSDRIKKIHSEETQKVDELEKPIGGIFDLWKLTSLNSSWHWEPIKSESETGGAGGHSAPGRLLEIADTLIRRAERLLPGANSVTDAIYGAVLVSDAFELLCGKTPSTSLKALTLKHQFEVLAECHSHGIANNFDVQSRLQELENQVSVVTHQFPESKRAAARLNAEITAVGRLVQVFKAHYQFDEEQKCLVRIRNLHQLLDEIIRPRCRIRGWFHRYTNFVLESIGNFAKGVALTGGILVIAFVVTGYHETEQPFDIPYSVQAAILTFLALQPPDGYKMGSPYILLIVPALIAGLFHFGVLVSHIYSLVARR